MAKDKDKDKPYLKFDNEETVGAPDRFYKAVDFNDLSKGENEVEDIIYLGIGSAALPNPIKGYIIQLPDGDTTTTALGWAASGEEDSGRYRLGTLNYGEAVDGSLRFDWNASRLRLASGFAFQIADMTQGSILFSGANGQLTQDNTNFFWNDSQDRLGIGTNSPATKLHIRGLAAQMRLMHSSTDAYFDIGVTSSGGVNLSPEDPADDVRVNAPLMIGPSGDIWYFDADDVSYHSGTSRFGFGTTGPGARVGILSTTEAQLRLIYTSGSVYSDFTVNSSGNLSIAPSGGVASIAPLAASSGTTYGLNVTGAINTGGSRGLFKVLAGASTGQTASTEIKLVDFDLSATLTRATGNLTNQRSLSIEAPTFAFAGASTITNAATVYIDRAPQAGTNATLTNAYALWVDDGAVRIDGTLTAGGLTLSGFTQGSVLFAGASGAVSQDNANLFYDDSNNRLGIGTATPATAIHASTNSDTYTALRIANSQRTWDIGVLTSGSTGALDIADQSAGASRLSISSAGAVTITGALGLGAAPTAKLEIKQSANTTAGGLRFVRSDTTNYWDVYEGGDTYLYFQYQAANPGYIHFTDVGGAYFGGSVGIGTTGPDRKVDILDASNPQLRLTHTDGSQWRDHQVDSSSNYKITSPTSGDCTWELEVARTITGAVTDGYAGAILLDPAYNAGSALTVTRHNYIDAQDVAVGGAGPAAVTDACLVRFDAAAGTHKATVGATTKTTPGSVDAWVKINVNGTIHYIPAYTSTTA